MRIITVEVKFAFGEYLFAPGVLYRIGEVIHGFSLGGSITWTSEDSSVPCGCVRIVVGAQNDKLIVDFGARQYYAYYYMLEPTEHLKRRFFLFIFCVKTVIAFVAQAAE